MALWFECKVRYDKMQDNGTIKKVNEPYLVDALTFTEAEARIIEEMKRFISGEFEVSAVKKERISELFIDPEGDKWYRAKVMFITLDEKTAKEKRSSVNYLVNAGTLNGAVRNIDEVMGGTMIDYVIASVAETTLMDVFEYGKDKTADEKPEFEQ